MYASMRPEALARPAGRARMQRAPGVAHPAPQGMARPALLRVARRSARAPAVDADQAGPWAPAVAMGVAATPLAVGAFAILAAYDKVTHALARTDDLKKLEGQLDKLRDVVEASRLEARDLMEASRREAQAGQQDLRALMEASRLEARDLMEASRREAQAGQQELRCLMLGLEGRLQGRLGRLEAAAAVLGAGLLAAWAGRKPGAAGRGAA
ncbi:MAG: hypothetical protein J3K34DRAFT_418895 [Monoraphidium minutum]|nr:MAG: hypothetical protein J3K34DRAFT_418895 [Monoraphidium minutum]